MRITASIIILSISSYSHGQIPQIPIETYEYDTNYIVNYGHLLAVRVVSPRRIYDFRLKNRNTKDIIQYRPNLQNAVGLGLTYKWLAFDIVFNPKWNSKKNNKFGDTKEFNIKGTLYLKKYMLDVFLRRYKGMHISNPQDYLNPWDSLYPYRPDLVSTNFISTFSVPTNSAKYSPKTTFQVDGRMKKSAGSAIYQSTLHLSFLRADSSIVPLEYLNGITSQAQITSMNMVLFKQSLGYAYTFVYKKFYLTLSAFPGLALTMGSVISEVGKYKPININFSLDSKSGFGYNSRRWYTGIYFIYNYQNINLTENLSFNSNLGEWRMFIGYRIHAPYIIHSILDSD